VRHTPPALAALAALALALAGCESTQEKSARLEKTSKHARAVEQGLSIAKPSAHVHVVSALLVRGSSGAAAVVTLRNDSARALKAMPLEITVKDVAGRTLFRNDAPGLEQALTSVAALPAHGQLTWVNDQVPSSGAPASVSALAGEAPAASGPVPRLEVSGVHSSEESGSAGAAGSVRNRSRMTQTNLVVYVLARRGGRVVAAGRAVLPEVAAGARVPFQAFFVGDPTGARLEASAPATTLG
jgi:hypothetical protein